MVGQRRLFRAVIISVIFHGLLVFIFQNQITRWDVKEYAPSHPAFIVTEIQTLPPPREHSGAFIGKADDSKQAASMKSPGEQAESSVGNDTQVASVPDTGDSFPPSIESSMDAGEGETEAVEAAEEESVQVSQSGEENSTAAAAGQASRGDLFSRFPIQAENNGKSRFREELENYIETHKRYPETAKRRGITGTVELELVINKDLRLKQCSVLVSSGSRLLDRDAEYLLRSFFEAQRSQAIFRSGEHTMTVNIAYNLE